MACIVSFLCLGVVSELLLNNHGRHVGLTTLICLSHPFVVARTHFVLLSSTLAKTLASVHVIGFTWSLHLSYGGHFSSIV
jgi:hypothetical protein